MISGGKIGAAIVDSLVFLLIWVGLITSGEEQQHAEEDGVRREQKNNGTLHICSMSSASCS